MSELSGMSTNRLGAFFSNNEIKKPREESVLDVNPQIVSKSFISDTSNWVKISGNYVAKGGEKFLIIGGFGNEKVHYNRLKLDRTSIFKKSCRYYIDNVILRSVADTIIKTDPKLDNPDDLSIDTFVIDEIGFEVNSSTLRKQVFQSLDSLKRILLKDLSIKIDISGYTDNSGEYEANLKLSENRAISVAEYLMKNGIDKSRIDIKYFGEDSPRFSNETPLSRSKNRRVEIQIFR